MSNSTISLQAFSLHCREDPSHTTLYNATIYLHFLLKWTVKTDLSVGNYFEEWPSSLKKLSFPHSVTFTTQKYPWTIVKQYFPVESRDYCPLYTVAVCLLKWSHTHRMRRPKIGKHVSITPIVAVPPLKPAPCISNITVLSIDFQGRRLAYWNYMKMTSMKAGKIPKTIFENGIERLIWKNNDDISLFHCLCAHQMRWTCRANVGEVRKNTMVSKSS